MLNFFDEPKDLIDRSISGLSSLGVDHVIVGDGAYDLFPGGVPYSHPKPIYDMGDACIAHGLTFEFIYPFLVSAGNETEKRQAMLGRAIQITDKKDWLVIWDCDYRLMSDSDESRVVKRLAATNHDVITIDFTEDPDASIDSDYYPMGMFLRAQPGIRMDGNHYTYLLPDGRRTHVLRRPVANEASAMHFSNIKILHDVHQRDPERRAKQTAYYEQRDRLGIES